MLTNSNKSQLRITPYKQLAALGDHLIGIGTQLKMEPKGSKTAGFKLDPESNQIIIEYERG